MSEGGREGGTVIIIIITTTITIIVIVITIIIITIIVIIIIITITVIIIIIIGAMQGFIQDFRFGGGGGETQHLGGVWGMFPQENAK